MNGAEPTQRLRSLSLGAGHEVGDREQGDRRQGNLKDTAEHFLSNIGNINKGNVRLNADQIRALTGIDINNEVRAVKVAQKFSNVFPTTGSRTQDVVRSIIASGMGTLAFGPVGMAAGVAATSPKLLGKAAIKIGKSRADCGAVKRVGDYLKDVLPGLSTKNVGDTKVSVTPESVAKNVDTKELSLISEFIQKAADGNPRVFIGIREKAEPMLRAMGIDQLPEPEQIRFLEEVMSLVDPKKRDAIKSEMSSPKLNTIFKAPRNNRVTRQGDGKRP
jgi:hypothetical protein